MEEERGVKGRRYKEDNNRRKQPGKKSKKGKKIAITFLVIVLILVVLLGIAAGLVMNKVGKIDFSDINKEELGLNDDLYSEVSGNVSKEKFNKIKNVALFGVDGGRSDAIIIASINQYDHSIKLLSIPRDTYVQVEGHGKTKINHSYAYGKEQLALKTINSNFGLNISEYVTINFKGLINVINAIGGIELEITQAEKNYINQYVGESYALTGKKTQLLSSYGKVKLTGEQALTHARNRTIGSDFEREERQRNVITAAMNQLTKKSIPELWKLSDSILKEVKTNLDVTECMGIATNVLGNKSEYFSNITSKQIPAVEDGKGQMISGVYYFVCDLDKAAQTFKDTIYE